MNQLYASQAQGAAPVASAAEDVMLELGWKCDPDRDPLGPQAVIHTWYRDVRRQQGPIVSYILIRQYAPSGPAATGMR